MTKRWYVVHVYSGFEKKIAQQIKEQAAQSGLGEQFEEVLVPTEQVMEVRRGAKVNTERKFFPGYVLVKMDLTDDSWHLVKNTAKVTGFLGGGGRGKPDHAPGPGGRGTAQARRQLRGRRAGQGGRRPLRLLQWHGRGCRRGARPPQGGRLDLRPLDPGRARLRPGGKALKAPPPM